MKSSQIGWLILIATFALPFRYAYLDLDPVYPMQGMFAFLLTLIGFFAGLGFILLDPLRNNDNHRQAH